MKTYLIVEGRENLRKQFFSVLRNNGIVYVSYKHENNPQKVSAKNGFVEQGEYLDWEYETFEESCNHFINSKAEFFISSSVDKYLCEAAKDDYGFFRIILVDKEEKNDKVDLQIVADDCFESNILKIINIFRKE